LAALRESARPVVLAVPEGAPAAAVRALAHEAGPVVLRFLPFLPQPEYDSLLWACDVNFVRGEDSFARAQWAAKPFIWHIYAQAEAAHVAKLDAFLVAYARMASATAGAMGSKGPMGNLMGDLWRAWNRVPGAPPLSTAWRDYTVALPAQHAAARHWRDHLAGL